LIKILLMGLIVWISQFATTDQSYGKNRVSPRSKVGWGKFCEAKTTTSGIQMLAGATD